MQILERKVENLQTRARFVPSSLNEENRTIDVVFATETPVRTFSWEDGVVDEILSCESGQVRLERFESGIPVLDNHDRSKGTKGQLAIVENWRFENGRGYATLRFSKRASVQETWEDVKDGILRGISVGYSVHRYEVTKEEGKRPVYRAVDWEPLEISFAPVPADHNSSVRNTEAHLIETKNQTSNMELKARALALGLPETATLQDIERAENEARSRREQELRTQAAREATEAERKRSNDITEAVRLAGLGTEIAAQLIKDGTDIHQSRERIINEIAKNSPQINGSNRHISVGRPQQDKVREAMGNALEHRANPSCKLSDQGREFRGYDLMGMARECLEQSGQSTRGMSRREVAMAALNVERNYNSSSDFPNILASVVNKSLRREYDIAEATFKPWTSQGSFADFREKTVVQLGDVSKMEAIAEGAEYKSGTFGDAKESYKAVKYGKIIPITWEALINDDLSAFSRIPRSIANQAKLLQNDIVYSILNANANMSDGIALFHASHGNLVSGAAISVASLQTARTAVRTQKALDGKTVLNLVPKFIVCGTANELSSYQYTSSQFVPTKNADMNPVYNTQLSPIIDPRITGNEWYLMASPGQVDTIEYSFLDGESEIFTEERVGFEVDGLQIKTRMVFGAKAIDWRGMVKNPGA
jgi:phage head maturation protease